VCATIAGVERVGALGKVAVVLVLALHLHIHFHPFHHFLHFPHLFRHRFHGPPFDYATLAAGAFASWVGVPGPGEPLLFAAGVLAAKHKLDLTSVLVVAFAAANAGGIAGWLVGKKAGRALLSAPGPFLKLRTIMLKRGDEVFERYVAAAIFVAPSFVIGIHRVRTSVFLLWNTFWAVVWTLGIGLGAYFAGPPILDVIDDLGWVSIAGLVVLVLVGVAFEVRRRRGRRAQQATPREQA
jgi:membrane protein DedA with SNARE-associated domain